MAQLCSGSIRFDGVSEAQLATILEFASKYPRELTLGPDRMTIPRAGRRSNVRVSWRNHRGYFAVHELVGLIVTSEQGSQ